MWKKTQDFLLFWTQILLLFCSYFFSLKEKKLFLLLSQHDFNDTGTLSIFLFFRTEFLYFELSFWVLFFRPSQSSR